MVLVSYSQGTYLSNSTISTNLVLSKSTIFYLLPNQRVF